MKFSSISQLEKEGIRLDNVLATSVTIDVITDHWDCPTEEILRDGLGPFAFVVLHSETVGFWAMAGSRHNPKTGASVWAEPGTSEAELVAEVKRSLEPLRIELMRSRSGEVLA